LTTYDVNAITSGRRILARGWMKSVVDDKRAKYSDMVILSVLMVISPRS